MIRPERLTARIDGDFVVFLIGMRINKPWKVHQWWPVMQAMPRMLKELAAHLPAWKAFNQSVGTNGDVGIWHETYAVGPGAYENIYVNMPAFGLGKVGDVLPATGHRQSAEARLRNAGLPAEKSS